MAQRRARRRTARTSSKKARRKRWLWIPKLILLAACVGLALFIAAILVMEQELRRTGIFESAPSRAPATAQPPPAAGAQNKQAGPVDEVTPAERRRLEALLE